MNAIRNGWTAGLIAAASLAAAAVPLAASAADAAPQNAAAQPACPARCGGSGGHGWHDGGHGWHHGGRGWRGPGAAPMFRELELTAAQRQSIRAIMQGARPDLRKLHDQMRANSMKLRQLTPDEKDYSAAAAEVGRENGSLFTQIIEKRADMRAKMYAVLTPAQKKQLAGFRAQMRAHRSRGCAGGRMAPRR